MFRQNELAARQRILGAGHMIGVKNALSHFSAENAVKNALDGDRAIRYIHMFAANPESRMEGFIRTARKILTNSICTSRMTLSVTAGSDWMPARLTAAFPEGTPVPERMEYREEAADATGFRIPAQIGFAARGYRLSRCGMQFSGSMWLAASILTLGYYWNRIRVQGGAYGAGLQIDRAGNLFSYSFRDPTPAKTLTADLGAAEYLRDFARSGEKPDKYIISALNELNPLLSPKDKGALADARALTGYTREESERIRREVLNTTPEQLAACGKWLDRFAREGSICVTAHPEALRKCEGLEIFDL
jgi:Zn-dependent M16 (insulinase) family peptidase